MLVQTDFCHPSGQGTAMYSRRGIQTISQHLCFREDSTDKYKILLKKRVAQQKQQENPTDDGSTSEYWLRKLEQGIQATVQQGNTNKEVKFRTMSEIKAYMDQSYPSAEPQLDQAAIDNKIIVQAVERDSFMRKLSQKGGGSDVSIYRYNPTYVSVHRKAPAFKFSMPSVKQQLLERIQSKLSQMRDEEEHDHDRQKSPLQLHKRKISTAKTCKKLLRVLQDDRNNTSPSYVYKTQNKGMREESLEQQRHNVSSDTFNPYEHSNATSAILKLKQINQAKQSISPQQTIHSRNSNKIHIHSSRKHQRIASAIPSNSGNQTVQESPYFYATTALTSNQASQAYLNTQIHLFQNQPKTASGNQRRRPQTTLIESQQRAQTASPNQRDNSTMQRYNSLCSDQNSNYKIQNNINMCFKTMVDMTKQIGRSYLSVESERKETKVERLNKIRENQKIVQNKLVTKFSKKVLMKGEGSWFSSQRESRAADDFNLKSLISDNYSIYQKYHQQSDGSSLRSKIIKLVGDK